MCVNIKKNINTCTHTHTHGERGREGEGGVSVFIYAVQPFSPETSPGVLILRTVSTTAVFTGSSRGGSIRSICQQVED